MVRILWMAFSQAAGAVKEAMVIVQVNSAIGLALAGKLIWLLPLMIDPHLFSSYPAFYAAFAHQWPEWGWACFVGVFAFLDVVALSVRRFGLDMLALLAGVFLFFMLSHLASAGAHHGRLGLPAATFVYLYGFAGVGCVGGMLKRVIIWAAQRDATEALALRRLVCREIAAGMNAPPL